MGKFYIDNGVLLGHFDSAEYKRDMTFMTDEVHVKGWRPMTPLTTAATTAPGNLFGIDKLVAQNIETFLIASVLSFGGQMSVTDVELDKVDMPRHRIVLEKTETGLMVARVSGELT